MKKFMITSAGSQTNWDSIAAERQKEIINSFMDWVSELQRQERLIFQTALTPETRVLTMKNNQISIDGPFVESKELLTGLFIITADSFEQALEIAKKCPGIMMGETVTITETES